MEKDRNITDRLKAFAEEMCRRPHEFFHNIDNDIMCQKGNVLISTGKFLCYYFVLSDFEVHLHEIAHAAVSSAFGAETKIYMNKGWRIPGISDLIEYLGKGYITYRDGGSHVETYPVGTAPLALARIAGPLASSLMAGFLFRDGLNRRNPAGAAERTHVFYYPLFSILIGSDLYLAAQNIGTLLPPEYGSLAYAISYLFVPAGFLAGYKLRDSISYIPKHALEQWKDRVEEKSGRH